MIPNAKTKKKSISVRSESIRIIKNTSSTLPFSFRSKHNKKNLRVLCISVERKKTYVGLTAKNALEKCNLSSASLNTALFHKFLNLFFRSKTLVFFLSLFFFCFLFSFPFSFSFFFLFILAALRNPIVHDGATPNTVPSNI